jgi:hypothetical protein
MVMKKIVGMIVPDVHEKIGTLMRLLAKYPGIWVVFLSDFFDSFDNYGNPTYNTSETCRWLKDNIPNPDYTFVWGNHDLHYAFPINAMICSGWNAKKLEIIRNHIGDTPEGWKKFKLLHWIGVPANDEQLGNVENQEWLISHAGLHPYLLNPVMGFDKKWLATVEEEAMYKLRYEQQVTPLLQCGRGRGGTARVGGVVWLDWDREFTPIEGLNQIVGHSPADSVRTKVLRAKDGAMKGAPISFNYCLDTHLHHVILVLEDGSFQIEKI